MTVPSSVLDKKTPACIRCSNCNQEIEQEAFQANMRVCPLCNWHHHLGARDRIAFLADGSRFREISKRLSAADPLRFNVDKPYRDRLWEAEQQTGLHDAVVAGEASVDGRRIVLICIDFEFMCGTMGAAFGEKVVRAFDLASKKRLPVIVILASGGARMQEGMFSLMQMAKTTAAVTRHAAAGLLYISVLTNPSFGGPVASFASLADILIAEPEAEIGFAGARVVEGTVGEKISKQARQAEALIEHGLIDMIVHRREQRKVLSVLLSLVTPRKSVELPPVGRISPLHTTVSAGEAVQLARHHQRPRARDYISRLFTAFVELHGDGAYRDDPAVIGGVADFCGCRVLVIGQQGGSMPFPEGFRKVRRLLKLAGKFRLPVVLFVDTPGAFPGLEAEYRGVARTIAESMATLMTLEVPIISLVIGEGGSGGALALSIADTFLMQENAIFSVISPEGAAAILFQDSGRSQELVSALKLRAKDLFDFDLIDGIVPEPPGGAHLDPDGSAQLVREQILVHLHRLITAKPKKLVARRAERFRSMGKFERGWMKIARNLAYRVRNSVQHHNLETASLSQQGKQQSWVSANRDAVTTSSTGVTFIKQKPAMEN
jgi:acetyl-CoA carboxylase carboxyl transferase subunit beta